MPRIALLLLAAIAIATAARAADTRSFPMGFTSWPYAATPDAVVSTTAFLRKNGDIVAEQMDNGVPWAALIGGTPLPEKFLREAQERAARWVGGPPVFLSATPLSTFRDAIANDVATERAPDLGRRPFADARVRAAYVAHCKNLIDMFKPAYFAYAIETNEFLTNAPGQAGGYAAFIAETRRALKQAYPKLPIGQTVSVHQVLDPDKGGLAAQAPRLRALLSGDHFTGISYYPFLRNHTDATSFRQAFDAMRALTRAPLVVSETGEIAEPLYLRALNFSLSGSPELQSLYIATLLDEAQKRKFKFIINWTHRDYDELLKLFPESMREIGGVWLRTGLLKADGAERPALQLWRAARARPLVLRSGSR